MQLPNPSQTRLGFLKKFQTHLKPIYLNFKLILLRVGRGEY